MGTHTSSPDRRCLGSFGLAHGSPCSEESRRQRWFDQGTLVKHTDSYDLWWFMNDLLYKLYIYSTFYEDECWCYLVSTPFPLSLLILHIHLFDTRVHSLAGHLYWHSHWSSSRSIGSCSARAEACQKGRERQSKRSKKRERALQKDDAKR